MSKMNAYQKQFFTYARRGWLVVVVGLLAIMIALPVSSTLAAPNNQTVPQPTPENTPVPVPTATPTDRPDDNDDDDGDDNDSSPEPTPTAAPIAEELTAAVNADRLNVRGGPSVDYDVIGKVTRDEVLTVLGRNEAGDWWFICCVADNGEQGWVSAQFLTPNFSEEAGNALPVVPADGPPPTPTPAPTPEPVAETESMTDTVAAGETAAMTTTETVLLASALGLSMAQTPAFAWQGQEMDLHYAITNSSDAEAVNVELRNELPALLSYVGAVVSDGGEEVDVTLGNGATVVSVIWPTLAAGEQVTATVTLVIAADAPNGAVIQNIAVADADNSEAASAGINIGMPPAALPDFR